MIQCHDGRTLLTVLETADLCGVSVRTVWTWIRAKGVETVRVGAARGRGRLYIVRESLYHHGHPQEAKRIDPIRTQVIAIQPPPVVPERRPVVYALEPPTADVLALTDRFQRHEIAADELTVPERSAVWSELIQRELRQLMTLAVAN